MISNRGFETTVPNLISLNPDRKKQNNSLLIREPKDLDPQHSLLVMNYYPAVDLPTPELELEEIQLGDQEEFYRYSYQYYT